MRARGPGLPKQPQRTNDPEYWRFRAKNRRSLAAETTDLSAKKILEDVASSYERLAEIAEQGRKEKPAEES
jgi:hypothetical protein